MSADHANLEHPTLYVAIYVAGPRYAALGADREPLLKAHIAYQERNHAAGKMVMGGPFVGETGGMALFRADSRAAVEAIVAADPAVAGEVYRVEIHQWTVARGG